ncbi:MAG: chlorite dismutase family protein [Acidobacteria bacterium]|jgi:chlorite dismutase|nr:chlorite dismutase family protein [Acidobacteriota bacterium]
MLFNFIGGETGLWRVSQMKTVVGEPLEAVEAIEIIKGNSEDLPANRKWILRGATSYERYTTRAEKDALGAIQPKLNRPEAVCAALIPIRKSAAWWNLAADQRREILEAKSKHIAFGIKYLPAIARRLHHSRDLPGEEFDFLTWFEYAPADAEKFDELVGFLRRSEEWKYVEREIDIRLVRSENK